jgi:hypothetical protein
MNKKKDANDVLQDAAEFIRSAMDKFIGQEWSTKTRDEMQKEVDKAIRFVKMQKGFEHVNTHVTIDGVEGGTLSGTIYISGLAATPAFPDFPEFPAFPTIKFDAVERMRKASEADMAKHLKKMQDDLDTDLESSRANCTVGCKYFGQDVIHYCCEFESMQDIIDRQDEEQRCKIPPPGWACKRQSGHDGPCAAYPLSGPHKPVIPRPKPTASPAEEIAKASIKTPAKFYEDLNKGNPEKKPQQPLYHRCKVTRPHVHKTYQCRDCGEWYCFTCLDTLERPSLWTRIIMWLFP